MAPGANSPEEKGNKELGGFSFSRKIRFSEPGQAEQEGITPCPELFQGMLFGAILFPDFFSHFSSKRLFCCGLGITGTAPPAENSFIPGKLINSLG